MDIQDAILVIGSEKDLSPDWEMRFKGLEEEACQRLTVGHPG
jgi:hypothetical protein